MARLAYPGGINKRTYSFYLPPPYFLFIDISLSSSCYKENPAFSSPCMAAVTRSHACGDCSLTLSLLDYKQKNKPINSNLGHPLAVLGLQALFGLLEVGVFVFVSGRLQVVVHGVWGAGCGCGYCVKWK